MSNDYDFNPINEECSNSNEVVQVNTVNSGDASVSNSLDNTSYQQDMNNRYDTVNQESLQPLYGGRGNNKYILEINDKKYIFYDKNEKNILNGLSKNLKINKDLIINIYNKKNKNKYILRNNKKKNFIKINY